MAWSWSNTSCATSTAFAMTQSSGLEPELEDDVPDDSEH
jgi:hypothetical protein